MKVYLLWYRRCTLSFEYEPPKVLEGIYAKLEDAREQAAYYEEFESCNTWIEEEVVYGAD